MMRLHFPRRGIAFPYRFSSGSRRKRGFKVWPLLVFGIFSIVYITANQETVPVSGRTQIVAVSPHEELALGLTSYKTILSQSRVVQSGPELERVKRIGMQIAKVTGQQDYKWEFNLIDSSQANAFALPGGKVAIYTGILPIAKNEDGLATILSHEIAHAVARHGAERMTHQKLSQMGTLALGMSVSDMDIGVQRAVMGAFGVGTQFGLILPFSREHESEADYIGLMYLARACFNPQEAPKLWERMGAAQASGSPAELLSTHPAPATRVRQFKQWMPEALRVRTENCG